jgi:hypothetical protein
VGDMSMGEYSCERAARDMLIPPRSEDVHEIRSLVEIRSLDDHESSSGDRTAVASAPVAVIIWGRVRRGSESAMLLSQCIAIEEDGTFPSCHLDDG